MKKNDYSFPNDKDINFIYDKFLDVLATLQFYRYKITKPFMDIKAFIQRGKRGYADCDCWNLDEYFFSVMPNALENLADNAHGFPGSMIEFNKKLGNPPGSEEEFALWQSILRYIAFCLREASEEGCSLTNPYDDVLEKIHCGFDYKKEYREKWADYNAYIQSYKNEKMEIALNLIKEYIFCFWD